MKTTVDQKPDLRVISSRDCKSLFNSETERAVEQALETLREDFLFAARIWTCRDQDVKNLIEKADARGLVAMAVAQGVKIPDALRRFSPDTIGRLNRFVERSHVHDPKND